MSESQQPEYKHLYARWQAANEAALRAEDWLFLAWQNRSRGQGDGPKEEDVAHVKMLRVHANLLLAALTEELATRPAPLL